MRALWAMVSMFVIIVGHSLSGCTAKIAPSKPTPTIPNVSTTTYPHCSSDRRGHYTTIEVPEITDTGQAPPVFFTHLHDAIMAEGRERAIYQVVSSTPERDHVVRLTMSVDTWKPERTPTDHNGTLTMQLFLIDKTHQCQVGQTTGAGTIRYDPQSGFDPNDIASIAESAGWFVGTTLMHDP